MGHTTQEELATRLAAAKGLVEVGGLYYHYKDPTKHYTVVALGIIEETEEVCVVYQALYEEQLTWVRPLEVWLAKVPTEEGEVSRFQKVQ